MGVQDHIITEAIDCKFGKWNNVYPIDLSGLTQRVPFFGLTQIVESLSPYMAARADWLSDMTGKSPSEQIQAMKERAGYILRKPSVSSARIVVTTDVEGIRNFYNIGVIHILAKSTDGRIRKMEKRLNNFIKERKYESKLKDRKMSSETPSIDSKNRDRFLCLVVSDMEKIKPCIRTQLRLI